MKNSLTGVDKIATAHLDKIADILDYVKRKYAKEDMVLSILMSQMKNLAREDTRLPFLLKELW